MRGMRGLACGAIAGMLLGCGAGAQAPITPDVEVVALGALIFHDPTLSGSGRMSCATCHDPALGHASPFDTPVAMGGPLFPDDHSAAATGLRNPPSLRYLKYNTAFRETADGVSGGFFWDGRANSLAEQAKGPFLSANEMANSSIDALIRKLADTPYADRFKAAFGSDILNQPQQAFDRMALALERYQTVDPDFAPFNSKFDAVNAGRAVYTPQELRGLAWFNRPDKGNCAACHPSTQPANAPGALFTDYSYDSLGVPRNPAIPANQDPNFFDLGLCGPLRTDLREQSPVCGRFKVPSLRNVALRKHFFHNGRFNQLADVVRFYVTRDTHPDNWYANGPYDDLPSAHHRNVNTTEGPYNRRPGMAPALNDSEMLDLLAFLNTLTDGYLP